MPAITYSEFGGGLDRRLPIGVQDANRLWTLQNAYITAGKKIKKRPGLSLVATGLNGSVGLETINNALTVFSLVGSGFVAPGGVSLLELTDYNPLGGAVHNLTDVLYAEFFQGFPYIVGQYFGYYNDPATGASPAYRYVPRHNYIDGSPSTLITDVNCPHGASVTKAASRIFSIGGEVVRYCKAGAARDWTTASDAGFLPTGLQQDTKASCTAVGTFEDALVVFFPDGSQIWDVAVDPTANQIRRRLYGVGLTHPNSIASFYRDLVFASPFGIRSISVQENVERLDETDVGVAIDKLVLPDQLIHELLASQEVVRAAWIQQFGQYWVMFNVSGFTVAYIYSFSKSSKLTCWSRYTFPIHITGITAKAGKVYVRNQFALYELSETQYTDDGTTVAVDVQMAFQDAKLPGVEKMFYGSDFVFSGTASVSYLYDPRDTSKETNAQQVQGDTRAGGIVPVEVTAAAIAPHFRHSVNEAFELDMLTLYYHPLSAQSS